MTQEERKIAFAAIDVILQEAYCHAESSRPIEVAQKLCKLLADSDVSVAPSPKDPPGAGPRLPEGETAKFPGQYSVVVDAYYYGKLQSEQGVHWNRIQELTIMEARVKQFLDHFNNVRHTGDWSMKERICDYAAEFVSQFKKS